VERILICERHATATLIEIGPLKPAPPVELRCPLCLASLHDQPEQDGTETHIVTTRGRPEFSDPRQQEVWDRRQAKDGCVIAGSPEESAIIREMDDARVEAIEADHRPNGRRRTTRGYVLPAFREAY
jgi:hypothetical protein